MRQYYMIAFWILLIVSVFHFALAAPVAVREILEVRPNVLKDGIAAWEKRMDSDDSGDSDHSNDRWSTNEAHLKDGDPGRNSNPDGAPGRNNDDDEDTSESDSEQMRSDGRGPHPFYNADPPYFEDQWSTNEAHLEGDAGDDQGRGSGSDSDAPGGHNNDMLGSGSESESKSKSKSEQTESDGRGPDPYYNISPPREESDDDDDNGDDAVESEQASTEHTPPTSPGLEAEHPATPEHMTYFENFEKLLKGSLRPRNSGSGAVGTLLKRFAGNR